MVKNTPVIAETAMSKKMIFGIIGTIVAGLWLCWSGWISDAAIKNRVAIAETKMELKTEIKGIAKTLDTHFSLLKEIRDDQKKRTRRESN